MLKAKQSILFFLVLILGLLSFEVNAEEVELPPEELAKEAVFPKFDQVVTIKNRNIEMANKIEVGGYYGFNFSEPINAQSKMGLNVGYHWSESSAIMMNYAKWSSGLNTLYTNGLYQKYQLDFNRAPDLLSSLWFHYEHTAYYGKISLTKEGALNLSMYPILGIGTTTYEHKSYFGVDGGVGLKFYFSKRLALRTDLKIQLSGATSPFLIYRMKSTDQVPQNSEFKDIFALGTIFDLGMTYLF